MTAVIGILNKQAVSIAADSAVTISGNNGRKIFNTANKIFTLSKAHPVGVMIYNSASFMTTPWETIIKSYRKQLSNKFFSTLSEYQIDFINYLKDKHCFTDDQFQLQQLFELFCEVFNIINQMALQGNGHLLLSPSPENKKAIEDLIIQKIDELYNSISDKSQLIPEYEDYTFESFEKYSQNIFANAIDVIFAKNGFNIEAPFLRKLKMILFENLRSIEFLQHFTGLIFVGFGEDEIYPSLIPLNISGVYDNRIRYFIDSNRTANISNQNHAAIMPFAQTDVIDTILAGVDPNLNTFYIEQFKEFLLRYNDQLIDLIGDIENPLSKKIKNIKVDNVVIEYAKFMQNIKNTHYIQPLMNAVGSLSKEDLAEMAESLIYLTYLKRRITFAEESVGGPVDVALISKGDGFIWIKRKHYFKPELNQHFFANNYKNC